MNPWMLQALADSRHREIRRDGAEHRERVPRLAPAPVAGPTRHRWPRMRHQVGYVLVEAGLRLLAADGPAARG